MRAQTGRQILLTGATGFVGKVVLESLLRRRESLGITRVHVLIRPRKGRSARQRFIEEIAPAVHDAVAQERATKGTGITA